MASKIEFLKETYPNERVYFSGNIPYIYISGIYTHKITAHWDKGAKCYTLIKTRLN